MNILHVILETIFLLACATFVGSISKHPIILIVSYDGFRYNFVDKHITPNIEGLKVKGTHARYMRNVFITKTLPNHHSIATGVYPETHGVLANKIYDPDTKKVLGYGYEMWHYNNEVLPIWTLNEMAGNEHHSGVMMWPGGEFSYQDIYPTFGVPFNHSMSWENRVDTIITWFLDSVTPANLVMLYIEEPDSTAHNFGPESIQDAIQIEKVDNITRYLHESLAQNNLSNVVNVFHVSDHGMTTVTPARIVNLTNYIDNNTFIEVGGSPALGLFPIEGAESTIYNALKNASQHEHFNIYRKEDMLERWHFKNNRRVPPLLALADLGYGFQDLYAFSKVLEETIGMPVTENITFGMHGYDNNESSMHPFFVCVGPLIKKNCSISPFDTVDLYSLFSTILNLTAPATNGSLENVRGILLADVPIVGYSTGIIVIGVILTTVFIGVAAASTIYLLMLKIKKENYSYRYLNL